MEHRYFGRIFKSFTWKIRKMEYILNKIVFWLVWSLEMMVRNVGKGLQNSRNRWKWACEWWKDLKIMKRAWKLWWKGLKIMKKGLKMMKKGPKWMKIPRKGWKRALKTWDGSPKAWNGSLKRLSQTHCRCFNPQHSDTISNGPSQYLLRQNACSRYHEHWPPSQHECDTMYFHWWSTVGKFPPQAGPFKSFSNAVSRILVKMSRKKQKFL